MANDFDDAAEWLQDEINYDVEELSMLIMEEAMRISPVHESTPSNKGGGRFKGNWIASVNRESDKIRGGKSDEGGNITYTNALTLARAVLRRAAKSGKDMREIYIQNNLPYAGVIDSGLYPNPPKKGTRINAVGTRQNPIEPVYEKRSSGGYSKQAPRGISDLAIKAALERSK